MPQPVLQTQVHFVAPLRELQAGHSRADEDLKAIGGLRRCAQSVDKLAYARAAGAKVRAALNRFLDSRPGLQQKCLDAIGSDKPDAGPAADDLEAARIVLAEAVGASDCEPLAAGGPQNNICSGILQAWCKLCGDPDSEAASWCVNGAPAGILEHPQQLGIFPDAVEDDDWLDPVETDFGDPEARRSYQSVEADPHAFEEVERLRSKGFLTRHSTLAECRADLGGQHPVVSKFGMITKSKHGKTKRRLILDSKESGVTRCGRKNQRIMLPCIVDVVLDTLSAHAAYSDASLIEWMVLDIVDAFWTLGLRPSERRFFVGKLRGLYYVYNRLAQGSRGAPLAWCRFFALVIRLTVAMFDRNELTAEGYVDDPIFTIAGIPAQRARSKAIIVLAWRALNLDLSFRKGQSGQDVSWIGSRLVLSRSGVVAQLQGDTVVELKGLIHGMLAQNLVAHSALRTLAGKISNAARLLTAWRPFLREIWAALSSDTTAPHGMVWVRQFRSALLWFAAFLGQSGANIFRPFLFLAYTLPAERTLFVVDASPWGFGGVYFENGQAKEYLHEEITEDDCNILKIDVGSPNGQQILEALAMLIALRVWRQRWRQLRSTVVVRGDNVTMLTMVLHFKGASHGLSIVAREVALELADAAYRPLVAEHIPGIANTLADALSRVGDPSKRWQLPAALHGAVRALVPPRPASWYRALGAPPSSPPA